MPLETKDSFAFGEFEVDAVARTLRYGGERVQLGRRSFDVLLLLAQHPGRIFSREEIIQKIWPDTFVEENTLSQSVSALRRALDERPGDNNFIATLPGRGYQFLAEVRIVPSTGVARATGITLATTPEYAGMVLEKTVHISVSEEVQQITGSADGLRWAPVASGRRRVAFVSVLVLGALVTGGIWLWRALRPAPYEHAMTVIADIDNETGDADFDHTLNQVLQIDLQQSPYFSIVGEGRIHRTLQMMNKPAGIALSAPLAEEACQRLNGQVYLSPAIASTEGHYRVSLLAKDCADGHMAGSAHAEVSRKSDVLAAFSALIPKVRRQIGESRGSLQHFNKPLLSERTSSLEALKAYTKAEELGDAGSYPESIAFFQRAVALDPNFAVAWADMGSMYYNMDDRTHAAAAISRAYALRDNANERTQLYIAYNYSQNVSGDLRAELEALRQWSSTYPDDNLPLTALVNLETWIGQYGQAAAHADHVLEIEHRQGIRNGISYEISGRAYYHANLPDKLRAVYAEAVQEKVDTQGLHGVMLELAAQNGDAAGIQQQIDWAHGTPTESHILQEAGCAALAAGEVQRAETLFSEARVAAQRDNVEDALADLDDFHVRMLAELGLSSKAIALLHSLPKTDPSLDGAFTEAEAGSTDDAMQMALAQQIAAPTDVLMNAAYVPSVRAVAALRQGRPEEAVSLLRADTPYEMRDPTVPYLRGQAFLALHRGMEAEAEFRKISGQPWLADPCAPLITLAVLGEARALALQQKPAEAAEAYRRFLAAWKQADADLPVLTQAKAELHRVSAEQP